jgi:hypothetical protein
MKYLVVLVVSAALVTTGVLATGGQLDLVTVFAVLVASCLPVGLAYEYRMELWPARASKPAPATAAPEPASRPAFVFWTPTASTALTPAVVERPHAP